ncbi:hypothetical protein EBR21_08255 [bacterium]|nr:hypothetical protein [bacterium]
MNERRFEFAVLSMWNFLHSFYRRAPQLQPLDFVVLAQHDNPRLLIDDSSDHASAYVAVEFPTELQRKIEGSRAIELQSLSIVCEEISHLFHYVNTAELDDSITPFELETLAEIDRFLCFMHWNDFFPSLKTSVHFENCSDLCEALFENRTFKQGDEELYRNAESLAFHHIRRAFSHCWTNRWLDTSKFDKRAQNYFVDGNSVRRRIPLLSA